MITIIDYEIGNLRSIEKAFESMGAHVIRSDRPDDIRRADKVVLPGVGAFGACIAEIRRRELTACILETVETGKPFLGVCVGMQLLFDRGEERGLHEGLGILPGSVRHFGDMPEFMENRIEQPPGSAVNEASRTDDAGAGSDTAPVYAETRRAGALKIPHMGWNTIEKRRENALLQGLTPEACFYFVHSYVAAPKTPSDILAACRYGVSFPAIVHRNNVYGIQFHPEKSGQNGLRILRNFAALA